jgi:TM2 domain-containing membrane protein YozV
VGIVCILGSCTLEKKHYSAGYHVEWKFLKNGKGEVQPAWQRKNKIAHQAPGNEAMPVEATAAEDAVALEEADYTYLTEELATMEVAAEKASPRFLRNAQKSAARAAKMLAAAGISTDRVAGISPVLRDRAGANPSPVNDGPGEVQWKAAVIAFFFGFLGLHRLYLGYTNIFLIQLGMLIVGMGLYMAGIMSLATTSTITLPILSIIGIVILLAQYIWVFWDFIRILFGRLQPNGDSYRKAFYK